MENNETEVSYSEKMEENMKFPQKAKNRVAMQSRNPTPEKL